MIRLFSALAIAFATASAGQAAPISRESLVQYQHQVDVKECNLTLSNGIRIEFNGLFANERNQTVFHRLVVFGIPTTEAFGFATLVQVSMDDHSYIAKVVRNEPKRVFLAMDATFLDLFWGSEAATQFKVFEDNQSRPIATFSNPGDMRSSRIAISNALSCYDEALASD